MFSRASPANSTGNNLWTTGSRRLQTVDMAIEQDKIPRELTWGIVGTFVGSALLWLLTNLKNSVLIVIFAIATFACLAFSYRTLRKGGASAGMAAAVVILFGVVAFFLGMGAHALVDALKK